MLCYIAVALGTFPRGPGACWQDFLVHSRAGLGLGGVLVVAASVVGALGEQGQGQGLVVAPGGSL